MKKILSLLALLMVVIAAHAGGDKNGLLVQTLSRDTIKANFGLAQMPQKPQTQRRLPARRAENAGHVLYEDFESVTAQPPYSLPEGWTTVATPGYPDDKWVAATLGAEDGSGSPLPGPSGYKYAVTQQTNNDFPSNSWMFSPGFSLEAGKSYDVIFYVYCPMNTNTWKFSDLSVYLGNTAAGDSMTELLYQNDYCTLNWTVVRKTITATASGTYYLGFHSASSAGSYFVAIDNVSVDLASAHFQCSDFIDFGTVKKDNSASSFIHIYNIGSQPLTLSAVDAPEGLTVDSIPCTIGTAETGDYSAEIPLTLNASNLPVGSDTTAFTLHTNDPFNALATVSYTANIIETRVTNYWFEDFENGEPEQWDLGSAVVSSADGVDDSHSLEDWAPSDNEFSTHEIRTGNAPHVSFWYKARVFGSGSPLDSTQVKIRIYASTDHGNTFNEVFSILPSGGNMVHKNSSGLAKVDFALPDEYKNTTSIFKFVLGSTGDWYNQAEYFFDNMAFGTPAQADLSVSSFHGSGYPQVGQASDYAVKVTNKAVNSASDWTVNLVDANSKEVLATAAGQTLEPNASVTTTLQWTPAAEGTRNVCAVVDLAGDEKLSNDTSSVLPVSAVNSQTVALNTGYFNKSGLKQGKVPIDFFFYHGVSQTLYTANELGIASGSIKGIQYKAHSSMEVTSLPAQFFVGEVSDDDLSSGKWIDMSKLTKVYDAPLYFSKYTSIVDVPFSTPFEYHGGNIVMCAVYNAPSFLYDTGFIVQNDLGDTRALTFRSDKIPVDANSLPKDGITKLNSLPVANFYVDRGSELGSIKGRVTNDQGTALTDAVITIGGTKLSTTTNWNGQYSFPTLAAGTYTVKVTAHGYYDKEVSASVSKDNTATVDFHLQALPTSTLSGSVKDASGKAIEGALVKVKGYDKYYGKTDAQGNYSISNIYAENNFNYAIEASAPYYETTTDSIIGFNIDDTRDFTLHLKRSSVANVSAHADSVKAYVQWEQPNYENRFDDGQVVDQLGYEGLGYTAVIGTVYRRAAKINKLQWYLTNEGGPHNTVNLFLFTLDSKGEPTDTLLASVRDIANTDAEWNTYELPKPVMAPHGFYFAVSTSYGFTALGKTTVSDEYPYVPHVYYASSDFSLDTRGTNIQKFQDITDDYGQPYHLALRAIGDDYGPVDTDFGTSFSASTVAALRPTPVYSVYRALADNDSELTGLSQLQESLTYTDSDFANTPEGHYVYAVVPFYDGLAADTTFSNKVVNGLNITLNLGTAYHKLPATATIRLNNLNKKADYSTYVFNVSTTDTVTTISHVDNGRYWVHVLVPGFKEYVDTLVVTDTHRSFDASLQEIVTKPRTLVAAEADAEGNVQINWTHGALFDDFEKYADFTANHIGNYQVKLNNEAQVKGIEEVDFTNEYAATPYIVFNPYTTSPVMANISYYRYNAEPWSGQKYLAVMAQASDADSWFVLPETTIQSGDELSFYGKSLTPYRPASSFEIGVADTSDVENFTAIAGTQADGAYDWTLYRYDLSQYAGQTIHLGIHNTQSSSAFLLMIDDLYLGAADSRGQSKAPDGFNIYLDADQIASKVDANSYTLPHVTKGLHKVGVSAVYGDNESEILWIDINGTYDGIDNITSDNSTDEPSYNVAGQRVSDSYKGVVIRGGKKYVRK